MTEDYSLFVKVMLIYPLSHLRKITGIKTAYRLEEFTYLNPPVLEKGEYTILVKNRVASIKNYYQDIRFLLREKDLAVLDSIFEKKGLKGGASGLVEILSKSVYGMMALSSKKLPALFTCEHQENIFELGHIEKFLSLFYRIKAEGFPPFSLVQVVHERVFEDFKLKFAEEHPLQLPWYHLISYLTLFLKKELVQRLKDRWVFYPVKSQVKKLFTPDLYNSDYLVKIALPDVYSFYMFVEERGEKGQKTLFSLLEDGAKIFSPFRAAREFQACKVESPAGKKVLRNAYIIDCYLQIKEGEAYKLAFVFPFSFITYLSNAILKKKQIRITGENVKFYLEALEEALGKKYKNLPGEFKVGKKETLVLPPAPEETQKREVKKIEEKIVLSPEDIPAVEDRLIQSALVKMKKKEILVILKTGGPGIQAKLFSNMSRNTREFYTGELEIKTTLSRGEVKAYMAKFMNILNSLA